MSNKNMINSDRCHLFGTLLFCLSVCVCSSPLNKSTEDVIDDDIQHEPFEKNDFAKVDSSVYRTVDRYACSYELKSNPDILVYGTKAWEFPTQNVSLVLSFPSKVPADNYDYLIDTGLYTITGFTVTLFVDTSVTRGYITKGGILTDTINLMFECDEVSTLMYEFWVYGIPNYNNSTFNLSTKQYNICGTNNGALDSMPPISLINKNEDNNTI